MRRDVEDPLDQARAAPRDLLELPPVLHRPPEADRYRGPGRAVHEEVRRPDLREPEEGREVEEGNGSRRQEVDEASRFELQTSRLPAASSLQLFSNTCQPVPRGIGLARPQARLECPKR